MGDDVEHDIPHASEVICISARKVIQLSCVKSTGGRFVNGKSGVKAHCIMAATRSVSPVLKSLKLQTNSDSSISGCSGALRPGAYLGGLIRIYS